MSATADSSLIVALYLAEVDVNLRCSCLGSLAIRYDNKWADKDSLDE